MTTVNLKNIIRVSCCGVENTSSSQAFMVITALCSDGSVWIKRDFRDDEWFLVNIGNMKKDCDGE